MKEHEVYMNDVEVYQGNCLPRKTWNEQEKNQIPFLKQ